MLASLGAASHLPLLPGLLADAGCRAAAQVVNKNCLWVQVKFLLWTKHSTVLYYSLCTCWCFSEHRGAPVQLYPLLRIRGHPLSSTSHGAAKPSLPKAMLIFKWRWLLAHKGSRQGCDYHTNGSRAAWLCPLRLAPSEAKAPGQSFSWDCACGLLSISSPCSPAIYSSGSKHEAVPSAELTSEQFHYAEA